MTTERLAIPRRDSRAGKNWLLMTRSISRSLRSVPDIPQGLHPECVPSSALSWLFGDTGNKHAGVDTLVSPLPQPHLRVCGVRAST
jgi:hypothetical protein